MNTSSTYNLRKPLLLTLGILFSVVTHAQFKVVHFEAYIDYVEHRALVFSKDKTCETLGLVNVRNQKPEAEELICYQEHYDTLPISLYETQGVGLMIDPSGRLYCLDNMDMSLIPKTHNLEGLSIHQLLDGREDIVVETDESDPVELVIRAIPLADYRLGRQNTKGAKELRISYETIVYTTRGQVSPNTINEIQNGIKIFPENGIADDEIIFTVPVSLSKVPCSYSVYVYNLKGHILKMYTNLTKDEFVLQRDNLTSGTYRYGIFLADGTIELQKGMFNLKEPPKPE